MWAFTLSLIIADLTFWHSKHMIKHALFGFIITILFFAMCQHGYEMVNWALLGLSLLFLVIPFFQSDIYIQSGPYECEYNECDDTC